MVTVEQRVSRLEGAYDHLATKADLYQLENRLIRWLFGLMVAILVSGLAAVASLVVTLLRMG